MRFVRLLLISALLVQGARIASGQEPAFTLRVDVPLVSVDVKVLDSKQRPLTSLAQRDFSVYEDGIEQQIQNFSAFDTPYNILLLFDRSGSTQEQWPWMQRAAGRFLMNLRPQDNVALAAFDEGLTMLSAWGDTHEATNLALERLLKRGPGGGTNLYRALERATQREFRNVEGRRAVVVLTDGRDNQLFIQTIRAGQPRMPDADTVFQRTMAVVSQSRVSVYFVAVNMNKTKGRDYEAIQQRFPGSKAGREFLSGASTRMEFLANASGGRVFVAKDAKDIVPVYDQISRDMSASYSLSYVSANPATRGQNHRIEVRVRAKGATIHQSRDSYSTN